MISPSKSNHLVSPPLESILHLFIFVYNFPMLIPCLEIVTLMKLLSHRQPMRARAHQVEMQSPRQPLLPLVPNLSLESLHPQPLMAELRMRPSLNSAERPF